VVVVVVEDEEADDVVAAVDLISGPVIIDNRKTIATVVAVDQDQATAEEATAAVGKSNVFENFAQSFPMANSFNLTYYIYIYIYILKSYLATLNSYGGGGYGGGGYGGGGG
jgi:uncharacterized membrane protein